MNFDPENPFQCMNKSDPRTIELHFQSELYYKPPCIYQSIQNSIYLRNQASLLIKKYAATGARDPVIPYLSTTYFDLYISSLNTQGIATENNYRMELFVTCCFIVAWKMRKPQFCLPEFLIQYNLSYLIEEIEDLEMLIDSWLLNRSLDGIPILHQNAKRPVTAFFFLDYLINLLTKLSENGKIYLKSFATQKLYALQYDIRYTAFKPSVVAAAAIAFCVDKYFVENATKDLLEAFFTCIYLNSDTLKLVIKRTVPGMTVEIGDKSLDNDYSVKSKLRPVSRSLAAAQSQSRVVSPPDRSQGAHADTRKMVMPPVDRSQGAHADTRKMMMLPANRSQGVLADVKRMISRTGIDFEMLPPPNQISALSNNLGAALTESVPKSLFPQSAPDRVPGAGTSLAQLTLSVPNGSPGARADTTWMMMPPPDCSPGARADTTWMVMPPADSSQGALADVRRMISITGIDFEKLPRPDQISKVSNFAAAYTQSVLDSLFPQSAPDRSHGASTSRSHGASTSCNHGASTSRSPGATRANGSPYAHADTTRMADERTEIDVEMLPLPNLIHTRTPSELSPPIDTEMLPSPSRTSREAKGKGKLYLE